MTDRCRLSGGARVDGLEIQRRPPAGDAGDVDTALISLRFAGGAIGAASGGLIGALIGLGIPEHEARFFEKALEAGDRILVVAHVREEESKEVRAVFERFNAHNIKVYS